MRTTAAAHAIHFATCLALVGLPTACGDEGDPSVTSGAETEQNDDDDDDDDGTSAGPAITSGASTTGSDSTSPPPTTSTTDTPNETTSGDNDDDAMSPETETSGDTPDTDTDPDTGGEPSDDPPPILPTWILRDADGVPFPALLSPACGHEDSVAGECPAPKIGDPLPYNCVTINVYDDKIWNVSYRLSNGSAHDCHREFASAQSTDAITYLSPDCSGTEFLRAPGVGALRVIDDELFYATNEELEFFDCPTLSNYQSGTCGAFTFGGSCSLYEMIPVPAEALTLLPNPPYTLTLEK